MYFKGILVYVDYITVRKTLILGIIFNKISFIKGIICHLNIVNISWAIVFLVLFLTIKSYFIQLSRGYLF